MNQRFNLTISLIPGQHNLSAYEELGLAHRHWPLGDDDNHEVLLPRIYEQMGIALAHKRSMLMHRISLDDTVAGFIGGFLIWGEYLAGASAATVMVERLFQRQVGPVGRGMIQLIDHLMGETDSPA